jgi:hypothetical protein
MIGFACEVAANTARTDVPGRIAAALHEDAVRSMAESGAAGTQPGAELVTPTDAPAPA